MDQKELDAILQVVENPIRRKIIRRLSQEPCYALQLSKELNLGQPLVAKHLTIMEEAGLVRSFSETSPTGPLRKRYSLAKGVTIIMDVGPNTFIEKGIALEEARPSGKDSTQESMQLRRRLGHALEGGDDRKRLSSLSEVISDVDKQIQGIESERADLLDIRNQAMREAAQIVRK